MKFVKCLVVFFSVTLLTTDNSYAKNCVGSAAENFYTNIVGAYSQDEMEAFNRARQICSDHVGFQDEFWLEKLSDLQKQCSNKDCVLNTRMRRTTLTYDLDPSKLAEGRDRDELQRTLDHIRSGQRPNRRALELYGTSRTEEIVSVDGRDLDLECTFVQCKKYLDSTDSITPAGGTPTKICYRGVGSSLNDPSRWDCELLRQQVTPTMHGVRCKFELSTHRVETQCIEK